MIDRRKMEFAVPGKIVYDPLRGTDKHGKSLIDVGRCTIQVDGHGICAYYAYQFRKKFGIDLLQPDWEPHVTVIARSKFNRKQNPWGFLRGQKVVMQYSNQMFWNDEHVWVAAECPEIQIIRDHYGNLSYDRGHMTIGRFRVTDVDRLPHFKKPDDLPRWDSYIWNKPL